MHFRKILIFLTLVSGLVGCQTVRSEFVPEDLIGVWKTSHEKYSDRFLELKRDEIVFGQGGDKFALHTIVNVEKIHEDAGVLYTISYVSGRGEAHTCSFFHDQARDTIRFKNQEIIEWTKGSIV